MENPADYSKLVNEVVLTLHDNTQSKLTIQQIKSQLENYKTLLGVLDALFSHLQGVKAGLKPSEEQIMWLHCGLTMLQPKWHLIFYGHLVVQVCHLGGLADKNDD
jgi:hypothetical protein